MQCPAFLTRDLNLNVNEENQVKSTTTRALKQNGSYFYLVDIITEYLQFFNFILKKHILLIS